MTTDKLKLEYKTVRRCIAMLEKLDEPARIRVMNHLEHHEFPDLDKPIPFDTRQSVIPGTLGD